MDTKNFEDFSKKMTTEGLDPLVIKTFERYYTTLAEGNLGFIAENSIESLSEGTLPTLKGLEPYKEDGNKALSSCTLIKLNGGLGTSMGLEGPKCLLPVKDTFSFFDIVAHQVECFNRTIESKIPLILMNSFSTQRQTEELLTHYPSISTDIDSTFLQNKFPKVLKETLSPANFPPNRAQEWNPPGHGDIFLSLHLSGILEELLAHNITYAFISNIDNLGATMDPRLLGYMAKNKVPFMMEVAQRTPMDRKGGHLARSKESGRLLLREIAQVLVQDLENFQNIDLHRYFNTNSIWVDLTMLKQTLDANQGALTLPLIVNEKQLVPKDKSTPAVYQLESAMGSAISLFDASQAVVVSRDRFKPVKKFDDLFILWSDCYQLSESYSLEANPKRLLPPVTVSLDSTYYGNLGLFNERLPFGPPSLLQCESLTIKGDVVFGRNVSITGSVILDNRSGTQQTIPDNAHLSKDIVWS